MKKRKGASMELMLAIFGVLLTFGTMLTVSSVHQHNISNLQKDKFDAYFMVSSALSIGESFLLDNRADPSDPLAPPISRGWIRDQLIAEFADSGYQGGIASNAPFIGNDTIITFCSPRPETVSSFTPFVTIIPGGANHTTHTKCSWVELSGSFTNMDGKKNSPPFIGGWDNRLSHHDQVWIQLEANAFIRQRLNTSGDLYTDRNNDTRHNGTIRIRARSSDPDERNNPANPSDTRHRERVYINPPVIP